MKPLYQDLPFPIDSHIHYYIEDLPHFIVPWHYHPAIEIMYITRGIGTRFVGDCIEQYEEGDVCMIGPNLPHEWRNDDAYFDKESGLRATCICLFFKREIFDPNFIRLPEMNNIRDLIERSRRGLKFTGKSKLEITRFIRSSVNDVGVRKVTNLLTLHELMATSTEYELLASVGFTNSVNSEDFDLSSYPFSYTAHLLSGLCPQINKEESETIEKKKYSILIVERDAVLRSYLTDILSSKFSVIAAKDGKGALEIALRERISVILTEIMIPIIDGFELCRQLKSNPTTSNIPIIILSSRLSEKDKWKGMDSGADLYIEKPFDSALLIRQIQNLIRTLETQRMISGKTLVPVPTPVSVESADSIFLQRALALIEKNMDDPSYDVENFVLDMAMSRSLLYKKIKLLTGHSVKTFILEIKLKRAVQLLTDTDLNISEISDRVGFTESRYFGTCFKKRFGMTPSEFIKEKRKADK